MMILKIIKINYVYSKSNKIVLINFKGVKNG